MKRAQAALRADMDRALGELGLTTPQYSVLSALERESGISNAELARRTFVTPQTRIRIVENLEHLGLIERKPHAVHGKILTTRLTDAGARRVVVCHEVVRPAEARMLSRIDAKEEETLRELLRRCVDGLEGEGEGR